MLPAQGLAVGCDRVTWDLNPDRICRRLSSGAEGSRGSDHGGPGPSPVNRHCAALPRCAWCSGCGVIGGARLAVTDRGCGMPRSQFLACGVWLVLALHRRKAVDEHYQSAPVSTSSSTSLHCVPAAAPTHSTQAARCTSPAHSTQHHHWWGVWLAATATAATATSAPGSCAPPGQLGVPGRPGSWEAPGAHAAPSGYKQIWPYGLRAAGWRKIHQDHPLPACLSGPPRPPPATCEETATRAFSVAGNGGGEHRWIECPASAGGLGRKATRRPPDL
jgi:hypothetical protein